MKDWLIDPGVRSHQNVYLELSPKMHTTSKLTIKSNRSKICKTFHILHFNKVGKERTPFY